MNLAINRNIKTSIVSLLSNKIFLHLLFWCGFLAMLVLIDRNNQSLGFTIIIESINTLFYAAVVYFNLLYLIPKYLSDKNFFIYCGLLLLSVIIIAPIKAFALYFIFSTHPTLQLRFVNNQLWYFIPTLIIAGNSTIYQIVSDWMKHNREARELQTQTMASELKFLRSQINPHFLFNTLNNLYALTLKKSDRAPEIVLKLSEIMRYMLYECNEKRVFLYKEVSYIKNYLDLERLRQGKDLEIRFVINGDVQDQKIAPLMFTPFLENSFKHGLNHQIKDGYVNIVLNVEREKVHFYIQNTKPDSVPTQNHTKKSGGIGLVNVKRRLDLIYPSQHTLEIANEPSSFTVDLTIDLI